jgi:hypothetical protein
LHCLALSHWASELASLVNASTGQPLNHAQRAGRIDRAASAKASPIPANVLALPR